MILYSRRWQYSGSFHVLINFEITVNPSQIFVGPLDTNNVSFTRIRRSEHEADFLHSSTLSTSKGEVFLFAINEAKKIICTLRQV
jgi:hypothetical protein